ncbi:disrupted in schizophrenia 1 protein isoform X2 [Sinocyclocheilus anshuiensis]|uniref:disrupted in schizophrenia 1 protein isoform X2 n=1 Tax=Sinocyclocheilus anshuiensis TaxID=1608454 RepID=UPI0007B87475|nr:PREDICTED: disrupted in schizophrenia 1 protein-like isoform X2 [Sinocyclocheilus anshuiensis]
MMFAGMIRVENSSKTPKTGTDSTCHRCAVRAGGASPTTAAGSHRRRPGYMRSELLNRSCDSERDRSKTPVSGSPTNENTRKSASKLPSSPSEQWLKDVFERDDSQDSSKTHCLRDRVAEENSSMPSRNVFNSSFSFIQQSLETSDLLDASTNKSVCKQSEWDRLKCETSETSNSGALKPHTALVNHLSQSEISTVPTSQSEHEVFSLSNSPCSIGQSVQQKGLLLDRELWLVDLDVLWQRDRQISSSMASYAKESVQDSDSGSLDTEVTSSLSIDSSDSTLASSVTSGYDSATPSSDQSRDGLIKKYEDVLQDCLQSNRTNTKIKSIMMKLQRLQHKAVLDDDYDTAERFGKKLEELRRERATLKPGLPSRHPELTGFLQRLRTAVHSVIHRTDTHCRQNGELSDDQGSGSSQSQPRTREKLLEEKQRIQKEMCGLQRRLEELREQSRALEEQLELEEPVLRACDSTQLRLMGQVLEDMITSEHRAQISVSPPAEIVRLQEQERALSLSVKEATAKVVMGQRLGSSLRRKVSESEAQLLSLHEAKLVAISGNDFSSAKELKAEIRSVYGERDRLEGLKRKLQALSTGSGRDLSRMKEQHNQIKLELQEREAQYERSLKESTLKYIELLEDRLHSCGSPVLEHIWEADLEACHLLLKGLDQRTSSISETEDLPSVPGSASDVLLFSKEEADCAMLTALGGRWCPEADLQHSEFTKDLCEETTELTEHCELISERLHYLEDQLQTAIDHHDKDLTLSLEKEFHEVKAALQAMLSQLKEEEEEDEEKYCDVEEEQVEDEELEEEHYFSDSWEI